MIAWLSCNYLQVSIYFTDSESPRMKGLGLPSFMSTLGFCCFCFSEKQGRAKSEHYLRCGHSSVDVLDTSSSSRTCLPVSGHELRAGRPLFYFLFWVIPSCCTCIIWKSISESKALSWRSEHWQWPLALTGHSTNSDLDHWARGPSTDGDLDHWARG